MTWERRPAGAAGTTARETTPPRGRTRREELLDRARANGDEVIELADGKLEIRKAKPKGEVR
ncbi:MAG: hypothetical protein ACLQQM_02830 [Acidimicrobiales bacterium]